MDINDFYKLSEAVIKHSKKGLGFVSPNPCVGCIILNKDLEVIAQGHHAQCGGDHAEVAALKSLENPEEQLKGASVFVSLEPCAHEGRTPSCAKTLAQYPIRNVIALSGDPNPQVAGQGFKILKDAEINCLCLEDLIEESRNKKLNRHSDKGTESEKTSLKELNGLIKETPELDCLNNLKELYYDQKRFQKLIDEYKNINRHFLFAMKSPKRPYVSLKWAQALNSVVACSKKRLMISGKRAQERTHFLRATHDLTLVGAPTVLQDNPSLNVRLGDIKKENKIAIVDSDLNVLVKKKELNIFKVHKPENVFIITDQENKVIEGLDGHGFNFIFVSKTSQGLDLKRALEALKIKYEVESVFVEGGVRLLKSFYDLSLFDEVHIYIAPKILRGQKSLISIKDKSLKKKRSLLGRDLYLELSKKTSN